MPTHIDIQEFQAMLLERKQHLLEILEIRATNIKDLHAYRLADEGDRVSAEIQGRLDSLIIKQYMAELTEIEASLQKIIDNVYGICEMCDDVISKGRLLIKPHARFCITCRELYENKIESMAHKEK